MNYILFSSLFFIAALQVCYSKPPIDIPPLNPNDPARLPTGVQKKVLIIGGGLAGLSSAIELADRGYQVTIKEKDWQNVGGKLRCVPFEAFPGQTFQVEHGFHAWFHNYFQFKDVRDRLGINDNFREWPKVHYLFKHYLPEVIYSVGPYPLNLLGIIERSPNLNLITAIKATLGLPDLVFYDFDHINEKYDNITFDEWAAEKLVPKPFYEIILEPALSVTLNERTIFSAAEMLAYMQIYFLSNDQSDGREVANVNYEQAVLGPWKDHLRKMGVKIMLNSTVVSLKVDAKTNNVYGSNDAEAEDSTVYDHVISAADVGAVQSILNKTYENYEKDDSIVKSLTQCNNGSVSKMKIAPDYRVLRVWFDKQMNSSAPDVTETPDFSPINLVAQYSLLEQEFIDWAAKTGGSVVEFHCYTWSNFFDKNAPDSAVWGLISPTVKLIYPEIFDRDFKVLSYHVNKYQNFASFQKGQMPQRPYTDTCAKAGLNNFYMAGDWVKLTYPAALMERAVSTGREAANRVLLNDHVRQASFKVINLKGPGL